jgi:hypothetical protein
VRNLWGKRVMGWDALKTTGNATGLGPERRGGLSDTAKVYWHGAPSNASVISSGIDWIAADSAHSYLDHNTQPEGFWWDIRASKSGNLSTGLLGGEACHWTDRYCYIFECLPTWHSPFTHAYNVSSYMYPPSQDAVFAQSVSGKIWPRAAVAAGSYWHFTGAPWESVIPHFRAITQTLRTRGVDACPWNCSCTELDRCGVPYPGAPPPTPRPRPPPSPPPTPSPPPPRPGAAATYSRACNSSDLHQRIRFAPMLGGGRNTMGRLMNSDGLCVDSQGQIKHAPLSFLPCANASISQLWLKASDGTIAQPESRTGLNQPQAVRMKCLDSFGERGGKFVVGIWPCSHDTKEQWTVVGDSVRDGYDGRCLSDAA